MRLSVCVWGTFLLRERPDAVEVQKRNENRRKEGAVIPTVPAVHSNDQPTIHSRNFLRGRPEMSAVRPQLNRIIQLSSEVLLGRPVLEKEMGRRSVGARECAGR